MRYEILLVVFALGLPSVPATGAAGDARPTEVAKVERIHGKAYRYQRTPHQGKVVWKETALKRGDRLADGDRVEVIGRLLLRFDTGKRFLLMDGPGWIRLRGARGGSGKVIELPSFRLPPIAREDSPGSAGGPRIRMGAIEDLYPRGGVSTLASQTTLRFRAALPGLYRVTVYDDKGRPVFSREVAAGAVRIPAKTLRPERRYFWKVRSLGRLGPAEEGQGYFVTLPKQVEQDRERLRREWAQDDDLRPWLAVIDLELRLLAEAKAELEEALARNPKADGLHEELADIEAQLAVGGL